MKRVIQEHILKNQEVFIGLEDSKRTWRLCVRNNRMTVHETGMPASFEVLENYINNKFPNCKINIMYEAGFRGFSLHDKLSIKGWNCIVTPPHTVTEEKCQKQKNDSIDCRRLARNLENEDYRVCHVPDQEHRENRQISRLHEQTQKEITRISNRIRRTLEFHGLDDNFKPGQWSLEKYRQLQEQLPDMNLSEPLLFTFNMLLHQLEELRDQKKKCIKELLKLSQSKRYKRQVDLLKSVPGIGKLTSIRLVLELGETLKRFPKKEQFVNFLGLIPTERSSGEVERKNHITKQGSRHIRKWLVESSWVAIRRDPVLLDKFNRVVSHSGSKKKAIVAVARKLAIRIRAVLMTGEEYVIGTVK